MASRWDEVQQGVDTVVSEARKTADSRLLGKNVVVLALEVSNDFLEAAANGGWNSSLREMDRMDLRRLVVDIVAKSGSVNDSECNTDTVLFEFCCGR